jgi:hypothetical protein
MGNELAHGVARDIRNEYRNREGEERIILIYNTKEYQKKGRI